MKSLLPVLLILFVFACNTNKKVSDAAPVISNDTITDLSNRRVMKDAELFSSITDGITIDTFFIVKDSFHILTSKVQACESENFKLVWSGKTTKSIPPQTSLKLYLMNDPACKEQHRFHLSFNVAPMKTKGDSVQKMLLKLGGAKQNLLY